MPQALIFDCDGTLADTMPAHHRAWVATLEPLGLSFPEARFYALAGVPTPRIAELLIEEWGAVLDPIALAAAKEDAYRRAVVAVQPVAPVVAIARAARGQQPLAVASGSHRDLVAATLAAIGVRVWFRVVVASEYVAHPKPDPVGFLTAAAGLGVAPADCTVYEDGDLGIEAARRAGMRWVDVRNLLRWEP
jgi:HAD superfamily hydrolase (TIGR01509 family)